MVHCFPQNSPKYCCDNCDIKTNNKKDFEKHLTTSKHKNNVLVNSQLTNVNDSLTQISPNIICDYICKKCNKEYKSRVGLWKHKKICQTTVDENSDENADENTDITDLNNIDITDSNIIIQLIKQNDEFKHILIEQSKAMIEQNKTIIELSKNNSITNNINSHNKTFNLQFFLNETCKDAMNIMDFVDSIKIQLCDLENVGKVGFVDGISSIIVKNLNLLDETKRPVHCADSKREVMYVKDEDKWEKENEDKSKMRKVIKYVTHKNTKLFKEFKEKYPGCEKSDSKYSTNYDKLIIEAFGGKGDNDAEKEDKIIRKIAKNVTINKNY
jgi:hypothetical protein